MNRDTRREVYLEGRDLVEDDGTRSDLFKVSDSSAAYHRARLEDKRKIKEGLCLIPTCQEAWTYNLRCEKHQKKGISLGELLRGKPDEPSGL